MEKRMFIIIGIIFVLLVLSFTILLFLRGNNNPVNNNMSNKAINTTDTNVADQNGKWIKDSRGVYVMQGVPKDTPIEVKNQHELINCSESLLKNLIMTQIEINSQCLGRCMNYSVDIVHVPRTAEDDLSYNQCSDYKNGLTKNFIELDLRGNVVRIV